MNLLNNEYQQSNINIDESDRQINYLADESHDPIQNNSSVNTRMSLNLNDNQTKKLSKK